MASDPKSVEARAAEIVARPTTTAADVERAREFMRELPDHARRADIAALIATIRAETREECAEACDLFRHACDLGADTAHIPSVRNSYLNQSRGAEGCAAAIRAMGQK